MAAAKERRKIPFWAMATLSLMPIWGFMYLRALTESPEVAAVKADKIVIGADLTNTKSKMSDPASITVTAWRGAYRDVLWVFCRKCAYVEQRRILRDLVATWKSHGVNVERAAGGDQMVLELKGEIARLELELQSLRSQEGGVLDQIEKLSAERFQIEFQRALSNELRKVGLV